MKRLTLSSLLYGFMALLLSACASETAPVRTFSKGEELAYYAFNAPNSWEEGAYGAATLRIREGRYAIDVFEGDNTLWWGQWGETYSDVVIDADVSQESERPETAFGIMCRVRGTVGQEMVVDPELAAIAAESTPEMTPIIEMTDDVEASATGEADSTEEAQETPELMPTEDVTALTTEQPDLSSTDEAVSGIEATAEITETPISSYGEGDGYLFLIQGTGQFGIFRARGRDLQPLIDWTANDAILDAPGENHLRAICAGNTLAFYANETLLGEASDDTYSAGQVGMVASAANRLGAQIRFDNLSISQVVAD